MKTRSLRLYAGLLALALLALANAAPALALSPAVETLAASSIAEKGATLNGKVNPNGAETKIYFEYGTTTSYGSKTSEVSVGSGTTTLEKSQAISGLSANTTYHYRIVATNSAGTGLSADKTFTTIGAPTVDSVTATQVGTLGEEVKFKAQVDPNGQSTTYQFEYGLSEGSLTNIVPIPAGSAGSGSEPVAVEAVASGLTPGTFYYVRISATNVSGKASSSPAFFWSSLEPGIQENSASEVSLNGARLNATISPYFSTSYYFEYGTTTSYGGKTATKEISAGEAKSVSESLSGLKANTTYHYRIVATNKEGTHTGTDQTFTTLSPITLKAKENVIEVGQSLAVISSNLTFDSGGWIYSCAESELTGWVAENPGALQSVSTAKMQNSGGAACAIASFPFMTVKFTLPAEGITLAYESQKAGEGIARTSTFTLNATYTYMGSKLGECEFSLQLSSPFALKTSLTLTLEGKTKLVKTISGECPNGDVAGTFTVTSKGNSVEAF